MELEFGFDVCCLCVRLHACVWVCMFVLRCVCECELLFDGKTDRRNLRLRAVPDWLSGIS